MPGRYLAGAMPVPQPQASQRRGPEAGLIDSTVGSYFAAANADEQPVRLKEAVDDAYGQLVEDLQRRGIASDGFTYRDPRSGFAKEYDEDAIWKGVAAARARDPNAFAGIAPDAKTFRDTATIGIRKRIADETDIASKSGWLPWLAGTFGYGASDPVNTATMMIGIGQAKTVAQAVLGEAVLNARIEALQTPTRIMERVAQGRDMTAGEAAANIAIAGVGAGALGGLAKGIELHGGTVGRAIGDRAASTRESAIAGIWDKLPAPVRERWTSAGRVTDDDLPEIAEAAIGAGNLSPDERAAMTVIVRERQIDGANPFVRNGAGVAAHREQLSDAIARVLADVPPAAPPTVRARLSSTTAIAGGSVTDVPARGALKNRIAVVESSGGRNYANPLSSARGKYQFLQSTWLHYYKQRFGAGGMSDAAILDKRTDPRLQDALMDDMTSENAAFLKRRGEAETAGNLYLVHFAGQGGARKLFEAEPNLRAADVLGEKVARANPWMKDMSAADMISWAHRKMNEPAPARGGARVQLADGIDGERGGIQAELDRLQAERSALTQSPAGDVAPDAADSAEAVMVDAAEALPEPVAIATPIEPRAAAADAAPAETLAMLPKLRDVVEDRSVSINQLARLSKDLGIPEADIRRGFLELAKAGSIRMNRKGQFARLPRDVGPVDALKFIGRLGVKDDEGHALVRGRNLQQLIPGAGPLIRPSGKSVDAIGEDLWDAGYFGPPSVVDRPDQNAVLDMLERAANGEKIYAHDADLPAARDGMDDAQQVQYDELADSYRAASQDLEFGVDDALIDHAIRRYGDVDPRDGLLRALNDAFDDAQLDVQFEKGEAHAGYDDLDDGAFRDPGWAGEDVGGRSGPDAGDTRQGGAAGRVADAEADRAPLNPDSLRAFDDPDAQAAKAQVDSLDHDLRALTRPATDPAIAERQAQQVALKADAPMRAGVDQETTIGSPLFDAVDQTRLQLDDGKAVTLTELFADLDAEEAAIKTVRDCL